MKQKRYHGAIVGELSAQTVRWMASRNQARHPLITRLSVEER